ncbi:MAG TPA: carboxypeptidase regulatory-like domain-containing protein [Longimicrobiales bacterium]|nr:carboxypeptidase regulatory-like domain-containing protein [Longimicrobiales bacterium]
MLRHRARHIPALSFLCALLLAPAAHAQVLTAGSIHGQVITEQGDPLRDARIVATSQASGLEYEARSDADGLFTLRFVAPGEYDLLIELLGYAPKRVTGVPARSSAAPAAVIRLRSVSGPAQQVDLEPYSGSGDQRASVRRQWIGASGIDALPHAGRTLADLVRLSSLASEDLAVEGLPSRLSTMRYAGVEWRPSSGDGATGPVPLGAIAAAELATNAVDVEWGGAAGGILSAHARTGARRTSVDARGTFAGDALPGATLEPEQGWTDVQGEARVMGPLAAGRGGFALGADARMLGSARSAAWAGPDAEALIAAGVAPDGALAPYASPTVQEGSTVRAFGSFDLPVGERHDVGGNVIVNATSLDPVAGRTIGSVGSDALDLLGTVSLSSMLNQRWWNHAQLGVTHGSVERDSLEFAPLLLVPGGLATSRSPFPGERTQTAISVQEAFGARFGAHDVKLGLGVRVSSFDFTGVHDTDGTYLFGGLDELLGGTGALVRTEPVSNEADWSTVGITGFVQDRWRPSPALELLVGARVEAETLPSDDVALDTEWLRLTGIANNTPDDPALRISPRAGLTWTPGGGGWRVEVATGVYDGRNDPELIAAWQADAGTARVRRVVGAVAWPPADAAGGTTALRLTVLDPDFAPPRSARMTAAITRTLGAGTSVQLSGTVRRTDNLPRRTDLNLTDDPVAQDQYGRALFGTLVKQGGLLVAEPGSGRRFPEYDEVAALSADGESKYWGVTLALDHEAGDALDVFARWTFSRTTDDWFGARAGGWTRTMPVGFDEWIDDTSDFDVPHRGVIGAVARAPFGLTLSALYRVQSGLPFTPGFRAGVDANADGIANNDPVFVDASVPGMSELVGQWSCLSDASGDFAERNACRADPVHTLDASAALRLFTVSGMSASVLVEAFDLLDAERRMPDSALYLVDPDAELDVSGDVVSVPLVANPDFGKPRAWPLSGRTLRLGLSLNW